MEQSITTEASVANAFAALCEPAAVASWFGTPTAPLHTGAAVRIDFGDGDFFEVQGIVADPPRGVRYEWRFLGLGCKSDIRWTVERAGAETVITVHDEDERRTQAGEEETREGWRDFLDRLGRFLATGESTRYDWRRDMDGAVELPVSVSKAEALLLDFAALDDWQPWRAGEFRAGAVLRVADDGHPRVLRLDDVDKGRPQELRYSVSSEQWKGSTHCRVTLASRGEYKSVLRFTHVGWEGIATSPSEGRRQRERFCGLWVRSLRRARALAGAAE